MRARNALVSSRLGRRTLAGISERFRTDIDTVIVAFPDIYGRLMGKRFCAQHFDEFQLEHSGTHGCDYLLTCDMDMNPISGFAFSNFRSGYGDMHLVPDMEASFLASWMDKTAIVFADVYHNKSHQIINLAPRSVLLKQLERARGMNYGAAAASELEFYTYKTSYNKAFQEDYRKKDMIAISNHVEDYHILQSGREEHIIGEARRELRKSGIPIECSKGEAGVGQHELNYVYGPVVLNCDRHIILKQAVKDIAEKHQHSVTFMAKPFSDVTGSGCHLHVNLTNCHDDSNAFNGTESWKGIDCSKEFQWFLGGLLQYTPELLLLHAPTVNSYKRFIRASWAPTTMTWSFDNRTAGFRIVGSQKSLRIEFRIPGADLNPYLGFAAVLAAGLEGIENRIAPPDEFVGNAYNAESSKQIPTTMQEAIDVFSSSEIAKKAFGQDMVEHYARFYQNELDTFNLAVTDWERRRYFELI